MSLSILNAGETAVREIPGVPAEAGTHLTHAFSFRFFTCVKLGLEAARVVSGEGTPLLISSIVKLCDQDTKPGVVCMRNYTGLGPEAFVDGVADRMECQYSCATCRFSEVPC